MIKNDSILTPEIFDAIKDGCIFMTGTTTNDNKGCNMSNTGEPLRWIAKKGHGDDWAIYIHKEMYPIEWIAKHGDKVMDKRNIKKLVLAHEYIYAKYRS